MAARKKKPVKTDLAYVVPPSEDGPGEPEVRDPSSPKEHRTHRHYRKKAATDNRGKAIPRKKRAEPKKPGPAKLTQKTILNANLAKRICNHIRNGVSIRAACEAYGFDCWRFYRWLRRGNLAIKNKDKSVNEQKYVRLVRKIRRAEAIGQILDVKRLNAFGKLEYKAVVMKLTRRWRDWQPLEKKVKVKGQVDHEVSGVIDLSSIPIEVQVKMLKLLEEAEKLGGKTPKVISGEKLPIGLKELNDTDSEEV